MSVSFFSWSSIAEILKNVSIMEQKGTALTNGLLQPQNLLLLREKGLTSARNTKLDYIVVGFSTKRRSTRDDNDVEVAKKPFSHVCVLRPSYVILNPKGARGPDKKFGRFLSPDRNYRSIGSGILQKRNALFRHHRKASNEEVAARMMQTVPCTYVKKGSARNKSHCQSEELPLSVRSACSSLYT